MKAAGLVFVPDVGEFVVKGSEAMNRAVDGDLVVIERAAKERDAEEAFLRIHLT